MPYTVAQALQELFKPTGNPNAIPPAAFKKGNYWGYPSREEWSKAFIAKKAERKRMSQEEKVRQKIKKEARDINEIAREYSEAAMRTLVEIMNNENEVGNVRINAANTILERGYGKAVTPTMNVNVNADAKPDQLNVADLDTEVARTLREVRKLTGGKTQTIEGEVESSDLRLNNRSAGGSGRPH